MTRVVEGPRVRALARGLAVVVAAAILLTVVPGGGAAAGDNATNASFTYEGNQLSLPASSGQVITADTALDGDDAVTIRLRGTGSSPFLRSPQATVGPDGQVRARVDLSRVEPGSTFTATLLHNGTALARTDGVVGDCDSGCEPTPTPDTTDDDSAGEEWLTETVVMATAGDVARVPVAVPNDGPVTVSVTGGGYTLAATARDTNGDGRLTFRLDTGDAGSGSPTVSVGSGDTVTRRVERGATGRLDPTDYELTVSDGPTASAREVDVGTLVLRQCRTCPSAGGSAAGGDTATAEPWPDDRSLLASAVVSTEAGGPVRVPLNVRTAATVTIGSESQGYRLDATVRDENGDGRVALLVYPRNAGTTAPTVAVGDADSVTSANETTLTGPLPAATYDIAVRRGTSVAGKPDDIGVFEVTAAPASNATATPTGSTVGSTNGVGARQFAGGLGAIALGGVLAVVGIAVVLGFARS